MNFGEIEYDSNVYSSEILSLDGNTDMESYSSPPLKTGKDGKSIEHLEKTLRSYRLRKGLPIIAHGIIIVLIPLSAAIQLNVLAIVLYLIMSFYIVGNAIRVPLMKENELFAKSGLANVVFDVMVSVIFTTIIVTILGILRCLEFTLLVYGITIIVLDFITMLRWRGETLQTFDKYERGMLFKQLLPFLISFALGFVVMLWRFMHVSWPETFGTDLFTHTAVSRLIIEQRGVSIFSIISSYPYILHTIVAASSIATSIDPFLIYSYGAFLTLPLILCIGYAFLKTILKDTGLSLIAASLLIFVNESGSLLGPYYFYPSVYAFAMVLLVMAAIRIMPRAPGSEILVIVMYAVIAVTYPSIILATFPTVLFLWSQWNRSSPFLSKGIQRLLQIGIMGLLTLFCVFYIISPLIGVNLEGFVLLIPQLTITNTLSSRIQILIIAYSVMQMTLFLIGLILLLLSIRDDRPSILSTKSDDAFIAWIVLLYLVIFFAPLEFGNRVEMFTRPFIAICIIVGAKSLVRGAGGTNTDFVKRSKYMHEGNFRKRGFSIIMLLIMASVGTTVIAMEYTLRIEPHNPHADEYLAFDWLSKNVPKGGYVLTDPATGFLMRAFTLRNCSTSLVESETFPYPLKDKSLFDQIFLFFNANEENNESYQAILDMRGVVTFIVVSPRTSAWLHGARQRRTGLYSPYQQAIPESDPVFSKFKENRYETVMQFGSLRILVRNEIVSHFFEPFDNVSLWQTDVGNAPYSEDGFYIGTNTSQPIEWTHIYTNMVSIADPTNMYIKIKYRSNISDVYFRVFSYSDDELLGNRINSDWLQLGLEWKIAEIAISDMIGFNGDPMESLSIGITSNSFEWSIFIDFIQIYEVQRYNASEPNVSRNELVKSIGQTLFGSLRSIPHSIDMNFNSDSNARFRLKFDAIPILAKST